MTLNLNVSTSEAYFSEVDKEIDWEENDNTKISLKQAGHIDKIIAIEHAIYLLRRTAGGYGHLSDTLIEIRRDFIIKYENIYEPYIEYNDYY